MTSSFFRPLTAAIVGPMSVGKSTLIHLLPKGQPKLSSTERKATTRHKIRFLCEKPEGLTAAETETICQLIDSQNAQSTVSGTLEVQVPRIQFGQLQDLPDAHKNVLLVDFPGIDDSRVKGYTKTELAATFTDYDIIFLVLKIEDVFQKDFQLDFLDEIQGLILKNKGLGLQTKLICFINKVDHGKLLPGTCRMVPEEPELEELFKSACRIVETKCPGAVCLAMSFLDTIIYNAVEKNQIQQLDPQLQKRLLDNEFGHQTVRQWSDDERKLHLQELAKFPEAKLQKLLLLCGSISLDQTLREVFSIESQIQIKTERCLFNIKQLQSQFKGKAELIDFVHHHCEVRHEIVLLCNEHNYWNNIPAQMDDLLLQTFTALPIFQSIVESKRSPAADLLFYTQHQAVLTAYYFSVWKWHEFTAHPLAAQLLLQLREGLGQAIENEITHCIPLPVVSFASAPVSTPPLPIPSRSLPRTPTLTPLSVPFSTAPLSTPSRSPPTPSPLPTPQTPLRTPQIPPRAPSSSSASPSSSSSTTSLSSSTSSSSSSSTTSSSSSSTTSLSSSSSTTLSSSSSSSSSSATLASLTTSLPTPSSPPLPPSPTISVSEFKADDLEFNDSELKAKTQTHSRSPPTPQEQFWHRCERLVELRYEPSHLWNWLATNPEKFGMLENRPKSDQNAVLGCLFKLFSMFQMDEENRITVLNTVYWRLLEIQLGRIPILIATKGVTCRCGDLDSRPFPDAPSLNFVADNNLLQTILILPGVFQQNLQAFKMLLSQFPYRAVPDLSYPFVHVPSNPAVASPLLHSLLRKIELIHPRQFVRVEDVEWTAFSHRGRKEQVEE